MERRCRLGESHGQKNKVPDEITDCTSVRIRDGKVLRYEMGQFYSIAEAVMDEVVARKTKMILNTI